MKDQFTIQEIAEALHCSQEEARKFLREVDPAIDTLADNPDEPVSRGVVIDLFAMRAGDIVGRRLGKLLGQPSGC